MWVKTQIGSVLNVLAPSVTNSRYLNRYANGEPEIRLLPALVPAGKLAIDVGANRGLYVHHLLKITPNVVAFEPLPPMQQWLCRNYGGKIRLEHVALSDAEGAAVIRFPRGNYSWATIAPTNRLDLSSGTDARIEEIEVPLKTLDSYDFKNVGFLKIDVEGHEEDVLKGASKLLESRPNLLIETEERHNPGSTSRIPAYLATMGFSGFYLSEGELRPLDEFSPARDQPIESVGYSGKSGRYINNFLFVPTESVATLKTTVRKLAS